jgi:hypothetical protein
MTLPSKPLFPSQTEANCFHNLLNPFPAFQHRNRIDTFLQAPGQSYCSSGRLSFLQPSHTVGNLFVGDYSLGLAQGL